MAGGGRHAAPHDWVRDVQGWLRACLGVGGRGGAAGGRDTGTLSFHGRVNFISAARQLKNQ